MRPPSSDPSADTYPQTVSGSRDPKPEATHSSVREGDAHRGGANTHTGVAEQQTAPVLQERGPVSKVVGDGLPPHCGCDPAPKGCDPGLAEAGTAVRGLTFWDAEVSGTPELWLGAGRCRQQARDSGSRGTCVLPLTGETEAREHEEGRGLIPPVVTSPLRRGPVGGGSPSPCLVSPTHPGLTYCPAPAQPCPRREASCLGWVTQLDVGSRRPRGHWCCGSHVGLSGFRGCPPGAGHSWGRPTQGPPEGVPRW